jgi:AbrB family looped-hinge helix DNA binding protein
MNLAKVSANGQVTVPVDVRRDMKLREGDKILFLRTKDGKYIIDNASAAAIYEVQQAFSGVAESLGNPTEEDIQSWVDEIRYGNGK